MTLTYEVDDRFKALAPVLNEHAEWFSNVMRHLFYPEKFATAEELPLPQSFYIWALAAEDDDFIEKTSLANLRYIHAEMGQNAALLINRREQKPDAQAFDALVNLYDDFVLQLRQLEHDSVQADSGIDAITGLRNRKAMEQDLERELERLARRGNPFCLVLARIDNFEAVRACMNDTQNRETLEKASVLIKRCVRSFDDAYRSGDAEFIMALKHSDNNGGGATIRRLRSFLAEEPIPIVDKTGKIFPVSMSYCAAEPQPGDNIETLLGNMRADLNRYDAGGDTALEYFELSPLQRFIHSTDK